MSSKKETPEKWASKMSDDELITYLKGNITATLPYAAITEFVARFESLQAKYDSAIDELNFSSDFGS